MANITLQARKPGGTWGTRSRYVAQNTLMRAGGIARSALLLQVQEDLWRWWQAEPHLEFRVHEEAR